MDYLSYLIIVEMISAHTSLYCDLISQLRHEGIPVFTAGLASNGVKVMENDILELNRSIGLQ